MRKTKGNGRGRNVVQMPTKASSAESFSAMDVQAANLYLMDFPSIRNSKGEMLVVQFRLLGMSELIKLNLIPSYLAGFLNQTFRKAFGDLGNEVDGDDMQEMNKELRAKGIQVLPDLVDLGLKMLPLCAVSPVIQDKEDLAHNTISLSLFKGNDAAVLRYLQHEEKGALTQAFALGGEIAVGGGHLKRQEMYDFPGEERLPDGDPVRPDVQGQDAGE